MISNDSDGPNDDDNVYVFHFVWSSNDKSHIGPSQFIKIGKMR